MVGAHRDKPVFGRASLVLLGLVAAALIVWLVASTAGFLRDSLVEPNLAELGQAGEFLNFLYGVPVAAIGAVVGTLTTVVAYQVANKQGDIHLLEFAVDKSQVALKLYRQLTGALGRTLFAGLDVRKVGEILVTRLVQESAANSRPTLNMLLALDRVEFRQDALQTFVDDIRDPDLGSVTIDTINALIEFKAGVRAMAETLDEIVGDIFASHFARRQAESLPAESRPLDYLRGQLPSGFVEAHAERMSGNIHDLSLTLKILAQQTVPSEMALAWDNVPNHFRMLELVGIVLHGPRLKLKDFNSYRGRHIGGYQVNLGAAYILTVSQLVPGVDTIADSFQSMFRSRSEAALKFLRTAFPDRGDFGLPIIMEAIDPCLADLHRLITVEVYVQGGSYHEFYDPALHGPIPTTGYEDPTYG